MGKPSTSSVRRLAISFSGGKTSAYMAARIMNECRSDWDEIVVIFANTGCEHEATLRYVDAIDRKYGLGVVWIEAVARRGRLSCAARVVDFSTAARSGEPFIDAVYKYGRFGPAYPNCTARIKVEPITNYLRSIGWAAGSYKTAIGIRADEIDRCSAAAEQNGWIYPLVKWGVRREHVMEWDAGNTVRLGIPEHLGNCVWCFKKSLRKLVSARRECPEAFAVPRAIESIEVAGKPRNVAMFRNYLTTADIDRLAESSLAGFADSYVWQSSFDLDAACGDSCEIGTDEADNKPELSDGAKSKEVPNV